MRKISIVLLLSILLPFGDFLSVFALDPVHFDDTNIQSSFDSARSSFETRYGNLRPFSQKDYLRIVRYEDRIIAAYRSLSAAKTDIEKGRANRRIKSSLKTLDTFIKTLEKKKLPSVAASFSPTSPETAASPGSWNNAVSANLLYYADSFEGQKTANGNVFRHSGFSAARCDVGLNTLLQVRYGDSSVLVKANDRPDCVKHGDIVDLTKTAFSTLAPLSKGRLDGSFLALGKLPASVVKEYLPTDFFSSFSVKIDANTPNLYLPSEVFRLAGDTTNGANETLLYVIAPSGKKTTLGQDNVSGSRFEYAVPLSEIGTYQFVIASGRIFSGAKALTFTVIDPSLVSAKQYFGSPVSAVVTVSSERRESGNLSPTDIIRVNGLPERTHRAISIDVNGATFVSSSMGANAFYPSDFASIPDGTKAIVSMTAQTSSTDFSIDTFSSKSTVFSKEMTLAPNYAPEKNENVSVTNSNGNLSVKIGKTNARIESNAFIITPSGRADKVLFNTSSTDGILDSPSGASLSYSMTEVGTYLVEVNYDTGFPAYIVPVNNGDVLSVLPNAFDLVDREITTTAPVATQNILASINLIRSKQGLDPLVSDATLGALAVIKAQDMSDHGYVGHTDSQGGHIRDTAKRNGITVTGSIGENVAGGTVSAEYLQAGLSLSGGHRSNMLGANWTKVGIGVVISAGKANVVELFGE